MHDGKSVLGHDTNVSIYVLIICPCNHYLYVVGILLALTFQLQKAAKCMLRYIFAEHKFPVSLGCYSHIAAKKPSSRYEKISQNKQEGE